MFSCLRFVVCLILIEEIRSASELKHKNTLCESFDKEVFDFCDCSFHGRYLNICVNFIKPFNKMLIDPEFFIFEDGKYRPIFRKIETVNFCQVISGKGKFNPFFNMLVIALKSYSAAAIHKCPYVGLLKFNNLTVPSQIIAIHPVGEQQLKISVSNGKNITFRITLQTSFI